MKEAFIDWTPRGRSQDLLEAVSARWSDVIDYLEV